MTTLAGPPFERDASAAPSASPNPTLGPLTIGAFTEHVCTRFASNDALVFDDPLADGCTVRWTYADVLTHARRVAKALIAAGVTKGTRVGVLMGNRVEAVAALLGAPMAGAVVVPLSTFAPVAELQHMLEDADVSVVLTQTELLGRRFEDDLSSGLNRSTLPYLTYIAAAGTPRWEEMLAGGARVPDEQLDARIAATHEADDALIIFSSGTTDRPKGMLHNHRAPTLQFWLQAGVFGRTPATRLWTALPVFWTAGFTAMGATLAAGGCWVMQETFEPGEALALMARERVTEPYSLPHQTAALSEHPAWSSTDLSALRCVFGKSAFARHPSVTGDPGWNMPVGYGSSETCTAVISHRSDAGKESMKRGVGRALPGTEVRIVDPESGAVLGQLETGEIALRGATLMQRYLGKHRDECFDADGFFHTGDAGFFDEDGYIHFTGRRTEMIKTGGANVSPAELEVQLRAFAPLKLARIVGIPDARLEQIVVLAATLKEGAQASEDDVRTFLRTRVASYKVPKQVVFFADGEIPLTASATKVRDTELIALVQQRLQQRLQKESEGQ